MYKARERGHGRLAADAEASGYRSPTLVDLYAVKPAVSVMTPMDVCVLLLGQGAFGRRPCGRYIWRTKRVACLAGVLCMSARAAAGARGASWAWKYMGC